MRLGGSIETARAWRGWLREHRGDDDDQSGWIFMVGGAWGAPLAATISDEDGDEFEQWLLDSGAFAHVYPHRCAEECDLQPATGKLTSF